MLKLGQDDPLEYHMCLGHPGWKSQFESGLDRSASRPIMDVDPLCVGMIIENIIHPFTKHPKRISSPPFIPAWEGLICHIFSFTDYRFKKIRTFALS